MTWRAISAMSYLAGDCTMTYVEEKGRGGGPGRTVDVFLPRRSLQIQSGSARQGPADIACQVIQHILTPRVLSKTASYDIASNFCLALLRGTTSSTPSPTGTCTARGGCRSRSGRAAHPPPRPPRGEPRVQGLGFRESSAPTSTTTTRGA